jgi:hypothetical protein
MIDQRIEKRDAFTVQQVKRAQDICLAAKVTGSAFMPILLVIAIGDATNDLIEALYDINTNRQS